MRVTEAGEGNGPPLIVIHDFLTSHLEFDPIIDELAPHFHIIAPDLPGFGASEKPSPSRYEYGVEAFAESMADLTAAYGLGRSNLIGHGLGGAIAITLAAHYAELVTRLCVVGPLCYPYSPSRLLRAPLWPVVGSAVFKQLFGARSFRSYFRDEVFSQGTGLVPERIHAFYESFNVPSARESAYAVLRTMLDTRAVVARLSRIRQPALVVWGRDDRIYAASGALRLAREIPNAHLELFDAGHCPHEEHPASFGQIVQEFFEGRR